MPKPGPLQGGHSDSFIGVGCKILPGADEGTRQTPGFGGRHINRPRVAPKMGVRWIWVGSQLYQMCLEMAYDSDFASYAQENLNQEVTLPGFKSYSEIKIELDYGAQ